MAASANALVDALKSPALKDAVRIALSGKNVFMNSPLVATGAAVTMGNLGAGANDIDTDISVPYLGVLGDYEARADGDDAVYKKVKTAKESATIQRYSLATGTTRLGNTSDGGIDLINELPGKMILSAQKLMDQRILAAAVAAGGLRRDVYNAGTPRYLDWELLIDAKTMFGDEQEDVVALAVSSKAYGDIQKQKDSQNRPLFIPNQNLQNGLPGNGIIGTYGGIPLVVRDSLPLSGSMGTVVPAGTTPPVLTVTGTPFKAYDLRLRVTVGGAHGTAKFQFSTDGGVNWSADISTTTAGASISLVDSNVITIVGKNGTTGLTVAFAAGTFNVDNTYTVPPAVKQRSLLLKRNALAFWYNAAAAAPIVEYNGANDETRFFSHLYFVAHRYTIAPGGSLPGVLVLEHN
jgi:hypothetical protein